MVNLFLVLDVCGIDSIEFKLGICSVVSNECELNYDVNSIDSGEIELVWGVGVYLNLIIRK